MLALARALPVIHRSLPSFALLLLSFFGTSIAHADDPPDPTPEEPKAPVQLVKPPPVESPLEVTVRGRKTTEPTAPKQTIEGREVRIVPGAFGDAFRALEALPGVTPIVSGLPYYFVRGAPPGNTGFFIDGVRVPGLFHLGIGPAVMYPALVDRVDLYKGAYPVSFGRFAGGIVAAETTRPADRMRADWTLRLFDAGALVEAPWGKHGENETAPGTALVSGRYGYPGLLLSIFAPDASLAYWDYQARATYRLSERDQLTIFSLGSYDSVYSREEDQEDLSEVLNIQWHRVDLRWDRKLSATGAARTALTLGYDRLGSEGFAARTFILGARTIAQEQLTKAVQVRGGLDAWMNRYDFRLGDDDDRPDLGGATDQSFNRGVQTDINVRTFVDAPLTLAPRVQITPGVRFDMYTSRGIGEPKAVPGVDPRVTTRIGIAGPVSHIGAVGIAHQPAAIPLPLPALSFSQLSRGLQGGYHMSQGLEIDLPWELTGTAAGYLHTYTGLVDLAAPCDGTDDPQCEADTRGRSVGLELMVKRNLTKRLGGWVAYTLSRSTRSAYDPLRREYQSVLSQFDRTHVVNVIASVDLGKGWRTGARYAGYSGLPYSTLFEQGLPNARTPFFHRIDVRIEKRWHPSGAANVGRSFAITAEMFNVLLMKEPIGIECDPPPKGCKPEEIGPIAIPSLGFEGTL